MNIVTSTRLIIWISCCLFFHSFGFATFLDHWKIQNPVAYHGVMEDAVFADGFFYLIGEGGEISRSSDAVYWTTVSHSQTKWTFSSIDFGNGLIIAVGSEGVVATSINGKNWNFSKLSFEGSSDNLELMLQDIAAGKDDYVAVGFVQNSLTNEALRSIAFHSTNGIDWVEIGIGDESRFYSVAYGADRYVISDAHGVYYSEGESWVYKHINEVSDYRKYVDYCEGIFFLRQESNSFDRYVDNLPQNIVDYISRDGVSWNETNPSRNRFLSANDRWWRCITEYSTGRSYPSYNVYLDRLRPSWFEDWDMQSDERFFKRYHIWDSDGKPTKLLYGNGIYLLVGPHTLAYFTPEDGEVHDARIDPPSLDIYDLEVIKNRLVYVGRERWGYTIDGLNWFNSEWRNSGWVYPGGVDFVNDILIFRNTGYLVLEESNIEFWNDAMVTLSGQEKNDFRSGPITFFKGSYQIFKRDSNLYLETNGLSTWSATIKALPFDVKVRNVIVGNDTILILSTNGQLFASSDLVNWSNVSIDDVRVLGSIVFHEGYFYGCGSHSIWRSENGLAWSRIDYSQTTNPVVDQQIGRIEIAGEYLCGVPNESSVASALSHIYVSRDGDSFRRIWLNAEISINSDYSWYSGIEYFRGRFWAHERRKVIVSPPLELVPDLTLASGMKKSNWFGIYDDSRSPFVNHVSIGPIETGIDFDTGEFYLISNDLGRFHIASPFREDELVIYSLDFDTVYLVSKYNDDLTRSTQADFYDLKGQLWADEMGPRDEDYESAMKYLTLSLHNLQKRKNLTLQYVAAKDHSAAHQFLAEAKLYYNACVRNAERTKIRIDSAEPTNLYELKSNVEQKLNEADACLSEAQNAYNEMLLISHVSR